MGEFAVEKIKLFFVKYKMKIIITVIIIFVGVLGVYKYDIYLKNKNFNNNIVLAESNYKSDKFNTAKKYYETALKYKDDNNVKNKIKLCDNMQSSYDNFNKGIDLFNKKDYLNAYNALREVIPEDKKRYDEAKNKIDESANLYINNQIVQAQNLVNKEQYQDAINSIDPVLYIESNNEKITVLKNQAKELQSQYKSKLEEKDKQDAINKVRNIIEVTNVSTSNPNSAGGVDLRILWINKSDKAIKYVVFHTQPYNAVGDIVNSDITNDSAFNGKVTGPIAPGTFYGGNTVWECAWYNNSIVKAEITGIDITYMDGSTETLDGEQIQEISY